MREIRETITFFLMRTTLEILTSRHPTVTDRQPRIAFWLKSGKNRGDIRISHPQEVAETCYLRLNLVLLAIEARKYEGGEIWINPKNKRVSLVIHNFLLLRFTFAYFPNAIVSTLFFNIEPNNPNVSTLYLNIKSTYFRSIPMQLFLRYFSTLQQCNMLSRTISIILCFFSTLIRPILDQSECNRPVHDRL